MLANGRFTFFLGRGIYDFITATGENFIDVIRRAQKLAGGLLGDGLVFPLRPDAGRDR